MLISDIKAGELHGRSGSIQAAINLEIPQNRLTRFNLKINGLNGQLPNLDLVNTVVKLCRGNRIIPTLSKRVSSNIMSLVSSSVFQNRRGIVTTCSSSSSASASG